MADDNYLMHYGTPRHSGRYPWGSGEDPYQHEEGFLGQVDDLKRQGITNSTEIAKALGMSSTEYRARLTAEQEHARNERYSQIVKLKEKGMSNQAIADQLGLAGESTVRSTLKTYNEKKAVAVDTTTDFLKKQVKDGKYIDIGLGVEANLGVPRTKMNAAIQRLKDEGYTVETIPVKQLGTDQNTWVKVLAAPGTTRKEIQQNLGNIKLPYGYSDDRGNTINEIKPPESVDSSRVMVRYSEDGGKNRDGVIEIRPGCKDLDLGNADYAQVRIAVDGTHYLKGMAIYSNDLPDGIDIRFNTNKSEKVPMLGEKDNSVLKPIKSDPDNPFGAVVHQKTYIDDDGTEHTSALNIVREEGDWQEWSKTISSQFLSKQLPYTAKKQLDLTKQYKQDEYNDISAISNPVIRKRLLESFADECDSDAVHLQAAGLPRQAWHVILPSPSMKETEVYAPQYKNGEEVILVRYPHGGTFEIPKLKVNNNIKEAKDTIGNAPDAVMINPKVAQKLSGADFDGDTVLVIPTKNQKLVSKDPLKGLKDFDPSERYPKYEGMPEVGKKKSEGGDGFNRGLEMGKISNLITDMTLKGADEDELARAVRHSMVIIDAEKHQLNWKQSEIDNDIKALKKKYQGREDAGASTLISRASADIEVPQRKQYWLTKSSVDAEGNKIFKETGTIKKRKIVDPDTGEVTYVTAMKRVKNPDGTYGYFPKFKTQKSTRMAETNDARTLSSGTQMENIYADYANALKDMARKARLQAIDIPTEKKNPSAAKAYAAEVQSLRAKYDIVVRNKPNERQAQLIANTLLKAQKADNPNMSQDEEKKLRSQLLDNARKRVGSSKKRDRNIDITPREWEAINSGALSANELKHVIDNIDSTDLKKLAMPLNENKLSDSKVSMIQSMDANGYSIAEIANRLGVSTSTVGKYLHPSPEKERKNK